MTRWRNLLNFGTVAGLSLIAIKNAPGPILTFFHNVKFWPDPYSIKAATEIEDEPAYESHESASTRIFKGLYSAFSRIACSATLKSAHSFN